MAIYDRKTTSKTDQDVAPKPDDTSKPAPSTTSTGAASSPTELDKATAPSEPRIETDEKNGPDVAALNANGPGTEKAREEVAAKQEDANKAEATSGYFVAEGRSITTKRGTLGPGEHVEERDFAAGQERLDELVKAGTLVHR